MSVGEDLPVGGVELQLAADPAPDAEVAQHEPAPEGPGGDGQTHDVLGSLHMLDDELEDLEGETLQGGRWRRPAGPLGVRRVAGFHPRTEG